MHFHTNNTFFLHIHNTVSHNIIPKWFFQFYSKDNLFIFIPKIRNSILLKIIPKLFFFILPNILYSIWHFIILKNRMLCYTENTFFQFYIIWSKKCLIHFFIRWSTNTLFICFIRWYQKNLVQFVIWWSKNTLFNVIPKRNHLLSPGFHSYIPTFKNLGIDISKNFVVFFNIC